MIFPMVNLSIAHWNVQANPVFPEVEDGAIRLCMRGSPTPKAQRYPSAGGGHMEPTCLLRLRLALASLAPLALVSLAWRNQNSGSASPLAEFNFVPQGILDETDGVPRRLADVSCRRESQKLVIDLPFRCPRAACLWRQRRRRECRATRLSHTCRGVRAWVQITG